MAFDDLRTFHDPDLILPIGGKEYRITAPSASDGLRIRQLFAAQAIGDTTELAHIAKILGAHWEPDVKTIMVLDPVTGAPVLDDDPESDTYGEPILEEEDLGTYVGGVWGEMDADGVSWEEIMHAGRTALMDVGMGRIIAEAHWVRGLAPYLADGGAEGNSLPPKPETTSGNRATRRAAAKKTPAKKAAKKATPKKPAPAAEG